MGVANTAPDGEVPASVIWSFYLGGGILLLSVLWTVFKTKEYPPKEYAEFKGIDTEKKIDPSEKGIMGFFRLIAKAPKTMLQLAVVQFFSWFALYLMWVYTTSAVAQHVWGCPINDNSSAAYQEASNWVGLIFGAYSLFAAIFSILMPRIANKFGRKTTYSMALLAGGIGYISMFFITNQYALFIPMIGVGIAWAGILAMPYAILSDSLPADKMGVYMGIFNFTIAGPQIVSGFIAGAILKYFFNEQAILIIVLAGVCMILGAISVSFVKPTLKTD
jgi:maltose/moltooligosaccharide transporter